MRSTLELLWMILFSSAILFFIFVNIFWRNRFQSENILILLLITAVVSIVVVKLGRQLLTLRVMRFLLPYNYLPSEGSKLNEHTNLCYTVPQLVASFYYNQDGNSINLMTLFRCSLCHSLPHG